MFDPEYLKEFLMTEYMDWIVQETYNLNNQKLSVLDWTQRLSAVRKFIKFVSDKHSKLVFIPDNDYIH